MQAQIKCIKREKMEKNYVYFAYVAFEESTDFPSFPWDHYLEKWPSLQIIKAHYDADPNVLDFFY